MRSSWYSKNLGLHEVNRFWVFVLESSKFRYTKILAFPYSLSIFRVKCGNCFVFFCLYAVWVVWVERTTSYVQEVFRRLSNSDTLSNRVIILLHVVHWLPKFQVASNYLYLLACLICLLHFVLPSDLHIARSTQPSTLRRTVKWVVTYLHGLRKVGTLIQLTGVA